MSELLDRRIAFPLLKELAKKGDSKVKIIFNTEIIERIERGYLPVVAYLVENRYLDYLPKEYFEYFSVSEHLKEKILYKTITPENRKYWLIGMYFFEKLYPYMSSFDVKKYISLIKAYGLNPNLVQNILFEPQFISLCAVNPNRIMSLRKALIHDLILTKDYVKFKLDLYVLNSYLDHLNEI